MYKVDFNNKIFPKIILELNKKFDNSSNNFKLNTVKSLINYFEKLN